MGWFEDFSDAFSSVFEGGANSGTYGSTYTGYAPTTIAGTDIPMPTRDSDTGLIDFGVGYSEPKIDHRKTGGEDRPISPIESARRARSNALANKQSELANAFAFFTDDYYDDLGESYSEFNTPLLNTAYDDSVRGIWEGFKSAGLLSTSDLNNQMSNLDQQKAIEEQRIKDSAMNYAMDQRNQVEKQQKKLGEQLSALVGGATSVDDINRQTDAINKFDIASSVEKLKTPNTKTSMDFFSDFNKVGLSEAPKDPTATFTNTPSPVSQGMMSELNPYSGLGIQTPYQGSATKVIA